MAILIDWQASGWKYLTLSSETATLPTDWNLPGFDDSAWSTGSAMFGNLSSPGVPAFSALVASVGGISTITPSNTADQDGGVILMRKTVTMVGTTMLKFSARPDNYCKIYINGSNVFGSGGWRIGINQVTWSTPVSTGDPQAEFHLEISPYYYWSPSYVLGSTTYSDGTSLLVAMATWNKDNGLNSNNPTTADLYIETV